MTAIERAAVRLLKALDRLFEGCAKPALKGWENGNGEPVGDEAQAALDGLRRAVKAAKVKP